MEYKIKLHPAQSNVLYALRHATRARYSELRKPTGLESDIFKYHLRKLVQAKYVVKRDDGLYELTATGKDFANRLNEKTGREIEHSKSSMLLVVRSVYNGDVYYMMHRRMREPYRGFWGMASAPILRGVPLIESAQREFLKQTGIDAQFSARAMYRVIDRTVDGIILEDKLFSVMIADLNDFPTPHSWPGGESAWLTREEIISKTPLFPTTAKLFDRLDQGIVFAEDICEYDLSDY